MFGGHSKQLPEIIIDEEPNAYNVTYKKILKFDPQKLGWSHTDLIFGQGIEHDNRCLNICFSDDSSNDITTDYINFKSHAINFYWKCTVFTHV